MYENLIENLRGEFGREYVKDAADAIEAQDRHILTLQHEMMAEAESHIAEVDRLNKQIEVLSKKEKTTQWIPVTEEPPLKVGDDDYNGYLVYANGYYEVADYTTDKFDNVPYFHVNGEYEPDVTHYMPLPEPPKER